MRSYIVFLLCGAPISERTEQGDPFQFLVNLLGCPFKGRSHAQLCGPAIQDLGEALGLGPGWGALGLGWAIEDLNPPAKTSVDNAPERVLLRGLSGLAFQATGLDGYSCNGYPLKKTDPCNLILRIIPPQKMNPDKWSVFHPVTHASRPTPPDHSISSVLLQSSHLARNAKGSKRLERP